MANTTYEIQANDAAGEASVAKVDMKFEIRRYPCLGSRSREGVLREARVATRRRLRQR
jgi:hypothetical protein